jgi:hypothetical protein
LKPRRAYGLVAVVSASLLLLVILELYNGFWMFWESKYDQQNLLGLTSAQVVQRLGPPSYDPRHPLHGQSSWRSEDEDGPLALSYYVGWAGCAIEFKNDHVVSVARGWK